MQSRIIQLCFILSAFILTNCGEKLTYDGSEEDFRSYAQEDPDSADALARPIDESIKNQNYSDDIKSDVQEENLEIDDIASIDDPMVPKNDEDDAMDTPPALDPAANGDPNIVVFRIASGTGRGSWNTEASQIEAKTGQIIRFVNDDTQNHRLHTFGAPCNHGPTFGPGETFDCVVADVIVADVDGALYEHSVGPAAEVWLNVPE